MRKIMIIVLTAVLTAGVATSFASGRSGVADLFVRLAFIAAACGLSLVIDRLLRVAKTRCSGCIPADIRIRDTVLKIEYGVQSGMSRLEAETTLEPASPFILRDMTVCLNCVNGGSKYCFNARLDVLKRAERLRLTAKGDGAPLPDMEEFKASQIFMECEFRTGTGERMRKICKLRSGALDDPLPAADGRNGGTRLNLPLDYDSWMLLVSEGSAE